MIQSIGREKMIDRLERLQATYGDRFKPNDGWEELRLFK